ncbi:hypothetical protein B0A48_05769 [Cryoendolithus antarcticus]|uniref:Prenyltransferase alpha-alpha toroid domain-containing protein n=1 Tax=Cryoendolithus antarcticus TaxID=1507870 RepID=A0A1V8TBW7_9PEZI|nr:hypothetical protein B0A48_05769 [Cryoendolithus antarcticus]
MESGVDTEDAPSFDKPRHIKYWTRCLKTLLPSMYTSNDSNRMYLAYFILSACDILGVLFTLTTAEEREGYLTWIYHCQHPNGGFRMWPGTDFGESSSTANAKWDPANGPATYFALASLMILRDDLQCVKRRETLEWVHRLQHADGSFGETIVDGKIEGGHDPRLAYCATGVRYILRHLEAGSAIVDGSTFSDIDIDALVGSIQRAEQSFDGGIADAPFHEPQAGYTFCSLGCMKFVERLRPDTALSSSTPSLQRAPSRPREVIRWLLNLQTTLTDPDDPPPNDLKSALPDVSSPTEIPAGVTAQLQSHNLHQSPDKSSPWTDSSTTLSMSVSSSVYDTKSIPAGFSGRPSKPPDTCYAFWALASLDLLHTSHLAARSQTRTYLLGLTQQAITGGFTKFAHDRWADLYHSYLGLVALSLSSTDVERAADGIVEVDAGMCPDLVSIACVLSGNEDRCCLPMPVLNRELAAITGIPEEVLYRYGQSRNSDTKVKFGWVRGRETTRVEDMSYCLFGIFGVFLPTLYGEKGNARERLVEEIKKRRKPTTYLSPACFPCLYTPEGLRANQQFRVPDFRPAGSRRWWAGTPQRVDAGRVKSIPVAAPPSRSAPGPAGRYANDHIPSAPVYQNRPILNNTQYQQGPAPEHGSGSSNAAGHTEEKAPGEAPVASDSGSTNVGVRAGQNQPGEKGISGVPVDSAPTTGNANQK